MFRFTKAIPNKLIHAKDAKYALTTPYTFYRPGNLNVSGAKKSSGFDAIPLAYSLAKEAKLLETYVEDTKHSFVEVFEQALLSSTATLDTVYEEISRNRSSMLAEGPIEVFANYVYLASRRGDLDIESFDKYILPTLEEKMEFASL